MADLPLLRDPDAVELTGTVERVIFHNEENGYTVLRLLPDKGLTGEAKVTGAPPRTVSRDPVSCVGHMVDPQAGVQLKVAGRWVNNVRFGRQVEFNTAEEVLPATSEGIRLYLASGLIKGVGEELAGRIVEAFGTDTIRVLDEEPERLLKVRGLGRKSLGRIRDSWAEHRGMRDLLLFLQPHGITPAYAVRIYRAYGSQALNVVRENPYRLAMDIHGIGFVTADAAAAKLGFEADNPLRIQAGTLYILQKATDDGNVYLPEHKLVRDVCAQLNVEPEQARDAIAALEQDERLVREAMDAPDDSEGQDGPGTAWKWASTCAAIIIANPKPLFISSACCTRPRPCALNILTRWWTRSRPNCPSPWLRNSWKPCARRRAARSWCSPAGRARARPPSSTRSSNCSAKCGRASCWPRPRAGPQNAWPRPRAARRAPSTACWSTAPRRTASPATRTTLWPAACWWWMKPP